VLKYRALRSSTSLAELPIVFLDRTHGSSKIPRSTLVNNFLLVPMIRLSLGR
jgi:dolichol-phosphate mannosyltransferase